VLTSRRAVVDARREIRNAKDGWPLRKRCGIEPGTGEVLRKLLRSREVQNGDKHV